MRGTRRCRQCRFCRGRRQNHLAVDPTRQQSEARSYLAWQIDNYAGSSFDFGFAQNASAFSVPLRQCFPISTTNGLKYKSTAQHSQTLRIVQDLVKDALVTFSNWNPLVINLSTNGHSNSGLDHAQLLFESIRDSQQATSLSKNSLSRNLLETPLQGSSNFHAALPEELRNFHSASSVQIHLHPDTALASKMMRLSLEQQPGMLIFSAHAIDDKGAVLVYGAGAFALAAQAHTHGMPVLVVCRIEDIGSLPQTDLAPTIPEQLARHWSQEHRQRQQFLSKAYRSGILQIADYNYDPIPPEFVSMYLTEVKKADFLSLSNYYFQPSLTNAFHL